MATFHGLFLKCVKISTVHPTDFANSKQFLLPEDKRVLRVEQEVKQQKYQAISVRTTSDTMTSAIVFVIVRI